MKKIFVLTSALVSLLAFSIPTTGLAQWQKLMGLEGGNITMLASVGPVLYAGTLFGDVYRSTDLGGSWSRLGDLWRPDSVQQSAHSTALVQSRDVLIAGTSSLGAFRSTDRGVSWAPASDGMDGNRVSELHSVGTDVWAATSAGIVRSSDAAQHWKKVGESTLGNAEVTSLRFAGEFMKIYAGTKRNGLQVSSDAGATWKNIASGPLLGREITTLALLPNQILAATDSGLYSSSNEGQTWMLTGPPAGYSNVGLADDILILSNLSYNLSSGNSQFTYRSSDFGLTWTPVKSFSRAYFAYHGFIPPVAQGGAIFLPTERGVYRSDDKALTWRVVNQGITTLDVQWLLKHRSSLFAAGAAGIFRSNTDGNSWEDLRPQIGDYLRQLVSNSGYVFAVADELSNRTNVLLRSSDEGATWQKVGLDYPSKYTWAIYADDNVVFSSGDSGIFMSRDNGLHWSRSVTGSVGAYNFVRAGEDYFCLQTDSIFRTTDGGNSWTFLVHPPIGVNTLSTDGAKIYALAGYRLFMSENSGQTWDELPLSKKSENPTTVRAIENSIFIGSSQGVQLSTNRGLSWTTVNEGLLYRYITVLEMPIIDGSLYITTHEGIWRRPLKEFGVLGVEGGRAKSGLRISPNPSSGKFAISFEEASLRKIVVTDILGRDIYSAQSVSSEIEFDLTRFAAGSYWITVSTPEGSTTRMILRR